MPEKNNDLSLQHFIDGAVADAKIRGDGPLANPSHLTSDEWRVLNDIAYAKGPLVGAEMIAVYVLSLRSHYECACKRLHGLFGST